MQTIAVIDGNSLMHRAFHAVPPYMTAPDGTPTNAIFGFLQMFIKLAEDFNPDGIACAFDHGIPKFRFDAIEQYKAHRPPTDPNLKVQFPIIKELLQAMNVPVVEVKDWEGDDVLGTLAHKAEQAGITALLVTGDKDALQLVSDTTRVVNTRKGMSDVVIYDSDAVFEKWGVTPSQVPDFLGLMGDTSDNIPGVPGVGPKRATTLLQEYGSLEAVLAAADSITGKMGESLRASKDLALASRDVATISCDIDLELDMQAIHFGDFDMGALTDAFGKYAMMQPLRRLLALDGKSGAHAAQSVNQSASQQANADGKLEALLAKTTFLKDVRGADALAALNEWLASKEPIALHLGNDSAEDANNLFGESEALYVASTNGILKFTESEFATTLEAIFNAQSKATVIAHDLKSFLHKVIAKLGSGLTVQRLFDVAIAAYLLDSTADYQDLQSVVGRYLHEPLPESTPNTPVVAIEAVALLPLYDILVKQLESDDSLNCFTNIEMPLVPVLCEMEYLGVAVDASVLEEINSELTTTIAGLRAQAYDLAGEEFNLDSPMQLGDILFEKLKLPIIKKRKKRGYSTGAAVLGELKGKHPLPAIMIEYRELAKLKSTYLDALPKLIAADGHIHTSFNQIVAATGRLSSSDPNLQNIPVRTQIGRRIREAFVADGSVFGEDAVFVSADYSQIELRLLAHLSGDEQLIAAFLHGEDFHAVTAAQIFGVELKDVNSQMRSRAKAVNFGIVYGQKAFGLSQSLGVSFDEAQDMIERYFAAYPQVRAYLDSCISEASRQGWVQTMFGRKRHITDIHSTNQNIRAFAERTAMNHPMQGSAADIIKMAMLSVAARLRKEGLRAQMTLQIHDELDFNCPLSELDILMAQVKEEMEQVAELKVPLIASVTHGSNWSAAH